MEDRAARRVGGTTIHLPGVVAAPPAGPEMEQRPGAPAPGRGGAGDVKRHLRRVARPTRAHIA
jgi:hypothetical protein